MRPLSVLYQLVLRKFNQHIDEGSYSCICIAIRWADLLSDELDVVRFDFNLNRPSSDQYRDFYLNPYFIDGVYWWSQNNGGTNERQRFLKMLIQKHKDDEARRKGSQSL